MGFYTERLTAKGAKSAKEKMKKRQGNNNFFNFFFPPRFNYLSPLQLAHLFSLFLSFPLRSLRFNYFFTVLNGVEFGLTQVARPG